MSIDTTSDVTVDTTGSSADFTRNKAKFRPARAFLYLCLLYTSDAADDSVYV